MKTIKFGDVRLDSTHGYMLKTGQIHKHRYRLSYFSSFFYVGFLCRKCDDIVLVHRDVWNSMIRFGEHRYQLWSRK